MRRMRALEKHIIMIRSLVEICKMLRMRQNTAHIQVETIDIHA